MTTISNIKTRYCLDAAINKKNKKEKLYTFAGVHFLFEAPTGETLHKLKFVHFDTPISSEEAAKKKAEEIFWKTMVLTNRFSRGYPQDFYNVTLIIEKEVVYHALSDRVQFKKDASIYTDSNKKRLIKITKITPWTK